MNYYNFLNESFTKKLNEARQDEINFANVFGEDILTRFKSQKQRMSSPENDFYYWIKKSREDLDGTIEELDKFISKLESKISRNARSKLASEGAEVMYEDDEWIVLKINTYAAAAKYGAGTTWCITGRYHGHEEDGEYYFNLYKQNNGWDYYFYIVKEGRDFEGRQEKYCLCYGGGDNWCVWDASDDNLTDEGEVVEGAPHVEGLPDIANELPESDDDGEEPLNDEPIAEPAPREPEPFVNIEIEDPNAFEFPAASKEEAAKAFKDGAEVIETLREPDLHIVKWHEEPEPRAEGEEGPEDTGDRYSLFVFIPGEGGGPLLAQTGNGFALQVFKDLEKLKEFAGRMPGVEIRNNREDTEDMPECLKENFNYYDDKSWYYDM